MRILIFSDVHGNLTALEAVLEAMEQHQDIDQVIFAGDACMFGPRPEECATRIRHVADYSVVGNTDEWIFEPPGADVVADDNWRGTVEQTAGWVAKRLSAESAGWLHNLPLAHRISPTGRAEDDLLIVHANPHDTMAVIYPPEQTQQQAFGEVRQPDSDLDELLTSTEAGAIAFGHFHYPNERRWRNVLLANISSVSMPADGDQRAKYGLLAWDGETWSATLHRVAYRVEEEIEAMRQHQPPGWQSFVERMQQVGE